MRTWPLHRTRLFALAIALLAARPVPAGEELPSAVGIFRLDGRPLAAGKIYFYLDDGEFVGSKIKDGRYKVTRIPAGEWRVAIEGAGVPARFASEETSGLRVTVKEGSNTFDIDLMLE